MSDKVNLVTTEFRDFSGTSKGFRIYDENCQAYDNVSEILIEDDMELLRYAYINHIGVDDEISQMLKSVVEKEDEVVINGTTYTWDQIKPLIISLKKNTL